jgi:hypothetical protein
VNQVILLVVTLALVLFGCDFLDPDRQHMTDRYRPVRLILQSEEVRKLVARQSAFAPQDRAEVDRFSRDFARLWAEATQESNNMEPGAAEGRVKRAMQASAERYIPERVAFFSAMTRAPSVLVPGGSYCRIIEQSQAICSNDPSSNPEYVRVVITSGPSKGVEGWGCEGDGISRTVVWP